MYNNKIINDKDKLVLNVHTFLQNIRCFVKRYIYNKSRRGRDCMVVGFMITYTISAYHH
jgi:hypothetical protein